MDAARNASEKIDDFQEKLLGLLVSIDSRLESIQGSLRLPARERTDQDIEDMAIHYLYQTSGNISEVVRKLKDEGVPVRRQSLMTAKKFSRFQEKMESYRGITRRGFRTDTGDVEALD